MSTKHSSPDRVAWFDLPVPDLDRAIVQDSEGNRIALHSNAE